MREQPDWINTRLRDLGGLVEGEPALRLVYAPDSLNHLKQYRYINPYTERVFNCFILERRMRPDFFDKREDWNKDRYIFDDVHERWVDRKGDFPPNEGYVMVCPITNDGGFLPLTESVYQSIAKKVKQDEEFAEKTELARSQQIRREEDIKQAAIAERKRNSEAEIDDYYKTNWGRINRKQDAAYNFRPR